MNKSCPAVHLTPHLVLLQAALWVFNVHKADFDAIGEHQKLMNVCTLTVNLVGEFFPGLIIIRLFPTNLICQVFLGMMKVV